MQRARGQEEKERRRREILNAALTIFSSNSGKMPSVSEIAAQAKLAKGTIYLYFKTREEIFLSLLTEKYNNWIEAVFAILSSQNVEMKAVIEAICHHIERDPVTLLLASTSNSILEKNIATKKVLQFKESLFSNLGKTAKILSQHFPKLSNKRAMSLLLQGYSLILGLWQISSTPAAVGESMQRTGFNKLPLEFNKEIRLALTALWRGTLLEVDR